MEALLFFACTTDEIGPDMLQMFDVEFDLSKEAQNIISIFQNEARMKRISLSLKTGDNNKKLGIRYVKADLVRLNQM